MTGAALSIANLVAVAVQFVLDHLACPCDDGTWEHLLPPALDAVLVAAGIKGHPGPLAYATVSHRLAVLASWRRAHGWPTARSVFVMRTR